MMEDRIRTEQDGTVLFELLKALNRATAYNPNDQVAPAVVLWTDKDRQWEPLVPRLREELPQFLTLGPYNPEEKTGPAIWLKCMIARTLPGSDWPEEAVPILYLPGVSRHELRAVEDCPRELQPLAELQYRGVWFTQENTKDWTVSAFLASKRGGLGLDVASTEETRKAILNALTKLADVQVAELRGRRLHAEDFRELLQPDLVRQLLRWLDEPKVTQESWTAEEWQAFCASCRDRYSFDPERDGELAGAEKLGSREGPWEHVWRRFVEAPAAYPHLPELLQRAKPEDESGLFFQPESWPQLNERAEQDLRGELLDLESLAPDAAAQRLEELEAKHGERRTWVWVKLNQAPLAQALEHLVVLARVTRKPLGGESPEAMATAYATEGWQADDAVLQALALVKNSQDVKAVKAAIRAVYKPWLEFRAEQFQELVRGGYPEDRGEFSKSLAEVEPGTCILFADGLRLDLGKRLRNGLEDFGLAVEESWRWVPLPPVTPTAKPAASPVADLITGEGVDGVEFRPAVRETSQPLTVDRFRKLLVSRGFQVLGSDETGDPEGRAWTEYGEIDRRGHDEGWKLARRIGEEVGGLVDRIQGLLDAGWREIRIVTDHGWLLMPGGLPKVEMPHYLVESRWTRCGMLKPGSKVELPTAPWYWSSDVTLVLAPGIGSFQANKEYSHGSLSLQECVVLDLVVRRGQPGGPMATLESIRWVGLRCRVRVTGAGPGWRVDLRTKAADPESSLAEGKAKPVELEGETSLVVKDPDFEGTAAVVVLLDCDNRAVAKRNTTVGGEA
jgi:hypothetical protein